MQLKKRFSRALADLTVQFCNNIGPTQTNLSAVAYVGSWGRSGREMLALSLSQFDQYCRKREGFVVRG